MKIDITKYSKLEAPFKLFIAKFVPIYGMEGTVTRWAIACHLDLITCYTIYNHLTGEDVSAPIKRLKEFYAIKD